MIQDDVGPEARRIQAIYAQREVGGRKDRQNPGRKLMIAERDRMLAQILERELRAHLVSVRALDVGCGDASQLAWLKAAGAKASNLAGVDLLPQKIDRARDLYPDFDLRYLNAETLPFPDHAFDLVMVMTVFSSIFDPAIAGNVAGEMTRVLRPGGLILWYDIRYPNPWNRNVRAMTYRRIEALFPDFTPVLQSATLIPQLARAVGRLGQTGTAWSYKALAQLPFLRSHLLGVLRAPQA